MRNRRHQPSLRPRRLAGGFALAAALLLVAPVAVAAQAEPTRLVIRAVAADAKVIGTGVGGARITVVDAETGDVLAHGVQRGGTGDTEAIMRRPHARGADVYGGESTAAFTAELALERPTRVRVTVEGPLDAPPASRQSSSATLWMIPGEHVEGEGLVLTLHGFLVEVLRAETGAGGGGELAVRARVTMMCGCPTAPGGLWDSDRYGIVARLVRSGEVLARAPMRFADETSLYRAALSTAGVATGEATLEVLVTDTERVNTGYARRTVELP